MNNWERNIGGMILTEKNGRIGRKTLYNVSGIWKNEYGKLVEWFWRGKTNVLGEKFYTTWMVDEWMSVEHWRNDNDNGKRKYWEKKVTQRRWLVNGWIWSICGMILTGGTKVLGEKHYTASAVDDRKSMGHWLNDTDWGKWSTGRKQLLRVGGRWMNDYGKLVEWYWQGKLKYLEKNIIQRWR